MSKPAEWTYRVEADIEADMEDLDPGTVFAPMPDHDTMEIAIPPSAYELTVDTTLMVVDDVLSEHWMQEPAIKAVIAEVRRRMLG